MTRARRSLISLDETPYYHVVARCVRRAWLWGFDEYAGKDYSHRKAWVLERLTQLASSFTIDVCAYAIMSNHYHLVLHVDRERAKTLSRREVVERWSVLFSKPLLVERWMQGACDEAERDVAEKIIERWRRRLSDVSWYMRCLNEHLARRANHEDGCSGRFWQGRFRSQALLDEAGLITAMAYVDLNPIRAGIVETPEASEFTSIYERIRETVESESWSAESRTPRLMKFASATHADPAIPFSFRDYLELLDWTGRVHREDRRGEIASAQPAMMARLQIDPDAWRKTMRSGGNAFGRALGRLDYLRMHAAVLDQAWIRGMHQARKLYA